MTWEGLSRRIKEVLSNFSWAHYLTPSNSNRWALEVTGLIFPILSSFEFTLVPRQRATGETHCSRRRIATVICSGAHSESLIHSTSTLYAVQAVNATVQAVSALTDSTLLFQALMTTYDMLFYYSGWTEPREPWKDLEMSCIPFVQIYCPLLF